MGLQAKYNGENISIGDKIRVTQRISERGKDRIQNFEGMLIAIKGIEKAKTITVRKIGSQKTGIERIFPLDSPSIEAIEIIKSGVKGVRQAKLYFVRKKAKRDIDTIYSRASKRK